ncbi:hypothetical protein GJR96_10040 [Haloferax sp. MBLA0076]|uniref:Halobacterial output domain-containing protein n=1 Tax=Haloferax litoreum TaxID=2666140 RepID=A0A6A8GG07_9EURY|nr:MULTISPECIES: HalOD1 output domain-containing protein [Haloferax]KAB1193758.1 hypothetical protein Hfx1148_10005 [Haloferax sp. CBA1148]MRX22294.1 hypothetical protein [Haloferax litoreum]
MTDDKDALTAALVDAARELGVHPTREPTRLQDAIDVESLVTLVRNSDPESDLQVSFTIWDIRYHVTQETVAASSRD